MTYAITILAAACCVLGFLLVCALVGGSEVRDRLQAKVEHRDARIEDLENELRAVPPTYPEVAEWVDLANALTERDAGHEGGEGA